MSKTSRNTNRRPYSRSVKTPKSEKNIGAFIGDYWERDRVVKESYINKDARGPRGSGKKDQERGFWGESVHQVAVKRGVQQGETTKSRKEGMEEMGGSIPKKVR